MKRRPLVLVILFLFFSLGLLDAFALCFFHNALDAKELAPAYATIRCLDSAEHPCLSVASPALKRIPLAGLERGTGNSHPEALSREAVRYGALTENRRAFHSPSLPIYQFDTVYRI
jgi:hypothetical protein